MRTQKGEGLLSDCNVRHETEWERRRQNVFAALQQAWLLLIDRCIAVSLMVMWQGRLVYTVARLTSG